MIISNKVIIKVNSRNFQHYKNILGDIRNNQSYEIEVIDILPTSHQKIEVKCDICDSTSLKPYREYIKSYNNMNIYCCSPNCAQIKNIKTNRERYGVDNTFQSEHIKDKIKSTNLKRYGVEYPSQSIDILSKYLPSIVENTDEFFLYKKNVRRYTNKNKKLLFDKWDGNDFYDKEYIMENLKLKPSCPDYPTIDHKISVKYGYLNGISESEIGCIDNLCITKRKINSSKGYRTLLEFNIQTSL